ncbi:NADH-quinone oxidoreductase subunit NuoN [Neisseria chenwenguii]|uniref:NADH-quinone oxidoreductase subunit N n=1 Tax=Neisseria chenwenguii TaxID=1853278 RepID=A0A220S1E9_9NEIS|nr:NADH-quinone oxidoreductase subunit NuoN [Neisseria chenwenguii]ASK27233.1 NADH-quinone oxidoreductase subunit N [Neisseria chenwenguii]ROV54822.1 NADH-quinone oxidoreductase subunit NuoN [Neisseria chenwenguii]
MNGTILNLTGAMPEIVLLAALCVILLADLWISDKNRHITHLMSLGAVILTAGTQVAVWEQGSTLAFNGMYIADGMSRLAKLVMYALVFGLFIYGETYNRVRDMFKGEFYTLSLFALLGMSVMVSAGHFLTAYIGLELLSLSLYAMIALRRDSAFAVEAALKYFVLGALASGLLLYGISMVYGATGTLDFAEVLATAYNGDANPWLLKLGLVFIVVAVAFKLGAVPFHMWVPDVYHGAPVSVTAFVGTAPKVAAVVFAFRILVTGLGTIHADWAQMFAILAIASLIVGNLAAIMQTNIKRMLAYSTISHMGFILLAFMAGAVGFTAGLYYAITYAVMAAVGFGVLMVLSTETVECEDIRDLTGLNHRHAWYAFLMLLAMFSMAGIPPLMGFYAKFAVIMALLSQGYVWLAVFAVIMSLIGAFYYLRVVKVMYFDNPDHDQPVGGDNAAKLLLTVNAALLLLWGIMPQTVIDWCKAALDNTL